MEDQRFHILCVDDDADILESLRIVLEKAGYRVSTALSGEAGLQCYQEALPDLIIVDLMMEEIDSGVHLVKELKARGNRAPVYMLSSTGDHLQAATDFSSLGLMGVFQKPIDPQTLIAILKLKLQR